MFNPLTDIKEGDIILVHKSKIKSIGDIAAPLIRKFTNCYYNHSALVVKYLDQLYIAEAVDNGFVPTTSLSSYLNSIGKEREIAVLRIKPEYNFTLEEFYSNIHKLVNAKYGFATLIFTQLIYQITLKIFGKGLWTGKTGEAANRTLVCSEVVANAFYRLFDPISYKITPADLFRSVFFNILWESNK